VLIDAERISQVISNYVINALKYAPEDQPIEVRLEQKGERALFSVRDRGPGLSPSEQEKIWERFQRVEGIKRQRGFAVGMGLGLYISRAIIEQHQGEVGVESVKGEGSTFWFTLPLIEDER
jgi:signal transduction histidine kinase